MKCKVCGRRIKANSKGAIFLYLTPSGPAYVCGKRCFRAWEED